MEQRKLDELRKRHAKIVFKAGIPFQVFDDDDLDDDQIFEMMGWFDEANEEGLLPIEAEPISEEERIYRATWQKAYDSYGTLHPEMIQALREEKDGEKGLKMIADMHRGASAYADEVCKKKGLK